MNEHNKHGGYIGDKNIIDYSVNINPFGISPLLKEKIIEKLNNLEKYPEIDGNSTKERISKHFSVSKENIIIGNGATELIYLFSRAMDFKNKNIGILEPTFTEYERASILNQGRIIRLLNYGNLINALENKMIDYLFICNPNNPTGEFISDIEEILKISKDNGQIVFIDESFIEFSEKESAISYIDKYNLFVLRSITKIYGIPGLRIGFGLGNKEIIKEMNRIKEPWSINIFALEAMDMYLLDKEYKLKTLNWYKKEKERFYYLLKSIEQIEVFDSEANYFMVKMKISDGYKLKSYCLDRGIYIRVCDDFYSLDKRYIRFAIRFEEQNTRLIGLLREFFNIIDK